MALAGMAGRRRRQRHRAVRGRDRQGPRHPRGTASQRPSVVHRDHCSSCGPGCRHRRAQRARPPFGRAPQPRAHHGPMVATHGLTRRLGRLLDRAAGGRSPRRRPGPRVGTDSATGSGRLGPPQARPVDRRAYRGWGGVRATGIQLAVVFALLSSRRYHRWTPPTAAAMLTAGIVVLGPVSGGRSTRSAGWPPMFSPAPTPRCGSTSPGRC